MGISLSHARYEEIKQIVVDLFVHYDVRCIPVSAFEVAAKMGIPVIPYSAIPDNKRRLLLRESEDGFGKTPMKTETTQYRVKHTYHTTLVGKNGQSVSARVVVVIQKDHGQVTYKIITVYPD